MKLRFGMESVGLSESGCVECRGSDVRSVRGLGWKDMWVERENI